MIFRCWILFTVCLLTSLAAVQADESAVRNYTVNPGQSIQDWLAMLEPGDTLKIKPGVYGQTVTIKTEGITLMGTELDGERTVFDGAIEGGARPDFAIRIEADNVTIRGMEIRNYKTGAVLAYNHDNISISDLSTSNTGMFGILSGKARNLRISRCTLRDASDTALAMDLVEGATLESLELYQNAIGLGAFDCINVVLSHSSIHHNSVGIALEDKGDKPVESGHVSISHCRIVGNGTGKFEADKPMHGYRGVGVYIQGYSRVEVSNCFFDLNGTYGIMAVKLANPEEVLTEHLHAHDNTYYGNGKEPSARFSTDHPGVSGGDIFWDGTGEGNRFQEEGELKTWPESLVTK